MEMGHEVWAFEGQHLASVLGTHYCLVCRALSPIPVAMESTALPCFPCHHEMNTLKPRGRKKISIPPLSYFSQVLSHSDSEGTNIGIVDRFENVWPVWIGKNEMATSKFEFCC